MLNENKPMQRRNGLADLQTIQQTMFVKLCIGAAVIVMKEKAKLSTNKIPTQIYTNHIIGEMVNILFPK